MSARKEVASQLAAVSQARAKDEAQAKRNKRARLHRGDAADPAVHRQARYAKVIRDVNISGSTTQLTLANCARIAHAVIFEADAEAALEPGESIALSVAWAQVQRGEHPSPNVAVVCVATLARLTGRDGAL